MAKIKLTENDIRKAIIDTIKEAHYRNVSDEIEPFTGRRPKSIKARINQIYKLVNKYGLSSRKYHDEHWQAMDDYDKVITAMGCEFTYWCENGGYTDYDKHTNMPMSKLYNIRISYDDGMEIEGYVKMMAAGSMEDPFDSYDTCMVLWPKQRIKENKLDHIMKYRLTESNLRGIIREAVKNALKETRLDYDVDNFSGRHYKDINYDDHIGDEGYLDNPNEKDKIENDMWEDDYYDRFPSYNDAENDYSWNLFNNRGVYPGIFDNYTVSKRGVDKEIDNAINIHNRNRDWTDGELRNGRKNMERYVQGRRNPDSIGVSWEDLHDD